MGGPDCLARWIVGVQNGLEAGDARPSFSTTPEGTNMDLESELSVGGKLDPKGSALITHTSIRARE